jgi:hypothetical protein
MKFNVKKVESVATTVVVDAKNPWKETKMACL